MIPVHILAVGITVFLLIPITIMLSEAMLGLPGNRHRTPIDNQPETCVIVVPAHNEGAGLKLMLEKLKPELPHGFHILVVADNCSDDTAAVARALNVHVIERNDPEKRGKGYALAFARDFMVSRNPETVIILDADSFANKGSLMALAGLAANADRPVQAIVELVAGPTPSPMVQISNFAYLFKARVRQSGLMRLGKGIFLGGTGMAFPGAMFMEADFGSDQIVEDLALGVSLAKQNRAALLVPGATVLSEAADEQSTIAQRTRWEHGFLDIALHQAMPLVWQGIRQGNRTLFFLGTHLLVPPLAMLFALAIGGLIATGILSALGASPIPALALLIGLGLASFVVLAAWARHGRQTLAARTLLRLPLYIAWKLPIYLRLLGNRQKEWNRTNRTTPDTKS